MPVTGPFAGSSQLADLWHHTFGCKIQFEGKFLSKTEEVSLILPVHWQAWQASHSFSSEVDWLTAIENYLGIV